MATYFDGEALKAQLGDIPGGEEMRRKLASEAQFHRNNIELYRRWETALRTCAWRTLDLDIEDLAFFGL